MNLIPTVVLAVLAGWSTLTQAQTDLPAAVGRISAVQGQVTLSGEDEPVAASLNWPVTANSHLVTASGARTEFRLGSTAVRLDADSDLEITQLDDDLLRLRLNYGSVSIRVRNADLLRDFELTTPQARITMIEPGLLRVDVERLPDTSQISMLAGTARVDGAGSSVTVSPGRQVDVTAADVRTTVARRDGFDVWADERDRQAEAVVSTQYVSTGMTGYEELDRHGSWTENVEYGPLWAPRNVAADWAPYRDGRWTWLAPWGWTWVDNAPWGYAPSHYGRWVTVRQRWYWAPGRPTGRPVWAPALVGWVGGVNHPNQGPGLGWYPLTPRDRFVPGYRVSSGYEQRLSWSYKGKPFTPRGGHDDGRDGRNSGWDSHRNGMTVLPRAQFEGRNIIRVNRGDHFVPRPQQANLVTPATPPRPAGPGRIETSRNWQDRDGNGRPDRFDNNPRNGNNPRGDGPRNDNNPRNDWVRNDNDPRNGWVRNDNNARNDNPRYDHNPRNDGPRNDHRLGRVIATNPALGQQPQQPQQPPQQQQGWQPGKGQPQRISTLPPNQIGAPDAPAQTINPRDVGIEIHTRPNGSGRPGNGALMPAPVLQIGNTRDRFQRDDNDRRQRDDSERRQRDDNDRRQRDDDQRRQRWQDGRSQQQPQAQQQPPQQQPQQQPQPDRPRFQPQQERPQQQDRPQQQERPRWNTERQQPQERPQPQAQPAQPPRQAVPPPAPPQAQPQQRSEQRQPREHRERPGQDQR